MVATSTQSPRFTLWHVSMLLVLIGIGISGYLSYVKLTDVPMICAGDGVFRCDVVQNSIYSRVFDIPIAWLGLGVYLLIGGVLLFQHRIPVLQEYGSMILFGIVLFSWLYSMYLVYLQFAVLQALCMWCLMHEINITLLFIVTIFRLKNDLATN